MPPTAPNLLLFFGHLHPMLVHLPIGFLILLAVVEVAARFKRFKSVAAARGLILFATLVSTLITVTCGLMLSSAGGYDSSLLFWHKWLGICLGCGVIAAAWACWKKQSRWYGTSLIITLLILAPASHFGGSMTHGKNYLTAYAPAWLGGTANTTVQTATLQKPVMDAASANLYSDLVQPIFQQNCLACHDANKSAGQLRLDSLAMVTRGGKSGPAVIAGNPAESLVLQRVQSPVDEAHHMPPSGKPQLTDDQTALLRWWVDSGATGAKKIAELNPSSEQMELVSRLLKLPMPLQPGALVPIPLAELQPQADSLCAQLGIVVSPVAVDQPWVMVNASLVRSFGDKEIAALSPMNANIVELNLAGTPVTDTGLASVARMTNLIRLHLDRTNISDAGLARLKSLKKLEYLNLYSTSVTDAGLKELSSLPVLRQLYIWKTRIDPAAAAAFSAAKADTGKIDQLQKQIEKLEAQIAGQHVEVVEGYTSAPATQPTTRQ